MRNQAVVNYYNFFFYFQVSRPLNDGRLESAEHIDEPFVNYQERMTQAMKELTRKAHDMVRGLCSGV